MSEAPIEFIVRLRGGAQASADAKKIEGAVKQLGGSVKRAGEETKKASGHFSHSGSALKKMAVGLGLAGAGFVAFQKGKQAIEFTTELARSSEVLSKATGMNIGESSKLVAVSNALGVSNTKLSQVFTKVGAATVKQSEHTGKHITAFDRLGISQKWARGHLNDTAGVLDKITHNFVSQHIPALERSKLLTELFGKSWLPLGRLFLDGETNFKHLTGLARQFGLELSTTGAGGIEKLKEQQEEYTLSTMGLKVQFTKIVAGPLGQLLASFAKLTVYAREGKWNKFNAEIDKMGKQFELLAEKVMPRVAESFAHIAPAVAKAFFNGFLHASLGAQALIVGGLLLKMGLVGPIAKSAFKTAGLTAGKGFQLAFIAALGFLAFELGKKLGEWVHKLHFHFDPLAILHGGSPITVTEDPTKQQAEQKAEAHLRAMAAPPHVSGSHLTINPHARHGSLANPILSHGAFGASVLGGGLMEVGERGPEVVHLPAGATVAPLREGSLTPLIENVIVLDGRVLARSVRKQTLQSQAAGA